MSEPLSFVPDLSNVDTSRPCPQAGTYIVQLTNAELVFSQGDQTKPMFKLTWALQSGASSVPNGKGEVASISPGYTITENVPLYQPEQKPGKNPSPDFKVRLAKISDALNNTDDSNRGPHAGNLPTDIGKKVAATTKVEESDEYGLQCRITKYAPAPAGA